MKKLLILMALATVLGISCNRSETNEVQREEAEEISTETRGTGATRAYEDSSRFPKEGTTQDGSSDAAGMGMDE